MNNKRLLLIFNPLSGKQQIKKHLSDIIDVFTKNNYDVTAYPTQCKADCIKKITSCFDDFDLIVSSGGDGTLSETISAFMNIGYTKPFGYIPAGSTNDFAYSVSIPSNMIEAARNIMTGKPFAYDVGSLNGSYFTYVAAFGAFVDVSYQTPQESKNALGHLAYVLEGIKRLPTISSYDVTVEHDGFAIRDYFILGLVTNAYSIGGYRNTSELNILLDDGLFEVTFVKTPKNPIELQNIITCALKQDFSPDYFYSFKTNRISFKSEKPIAWTLDGEDGGIHTDCEIICHNKAQKIIINTGY